MSFLLSLILGTIAVFVSAYILPGVKIDGWTTALILAIVLGIINATIRPILLILTLPINILTFVIIALCVMLASAIVPGFHVDGFWWAMAFGVVLAIVNSFINPTSPF